MKNSDSSQGAPAGAGDGAASSDATADSLSGLKTEVASKKSGYVRLLVKVVVSMGLLAWLVYGLDWAEITTAASRLSAWTWLTALLLYMLAQALSGLRWMQAARALDLKASLWQCVQLYFLGMFFNLFLPTGFGGDAVKSYYLGRANKNQVSAAFSVFLERITGLVALLCLGAGALFYLPVAGHSDPESTDAVATLQMQPVPVLQALFLAGSAVAAAIGLLLLPWIFSAFARFSPRILGWLGPMEVFKRHYPVLGSLVFTSFFIQGLNVVCVVLIGRNLGVAVPVAYLCMTFALVVMATLVPLSISGLGIREAGFVLLLQQAGIPAETALALSILFFSVQVAASLPGVIPFLMWKKASLPARATS